MNTKYFFPSLIVSVVFLVGCTAKPATNTATATPVATQQVQTEQTAAQKIANAVANNRSVKCEITKKDGTDTITFEMKGKKSRVTGASLSGGKGTGYMINDGEYIYIWSDADKKGVKMSLALAMPSGSPVAGQKYDDFTKEDVQKQYEDLGYTYTCDEADISDRVFTVPADVTFTDMSEMMKSMQGMQHNAQTGKTPTPQEMQNMMDDAKRMQSQ